jgi:3-oxoacyl-[acyl-carrier-protein] synthase II
VTLNQATVAGELAVARAAMMVASGRLEAALAGGVDEISPILHRTLSVLGGLSPTDGADEGCWPFDRRGNGAVRGEGATFILMEALDAALRRGAVIHAELAGVAWGNHPAGWGRVPSTRDGAVIRSALARAGLRPEEIGWAYLTGTGDRRADDRELDLIADAFGPRPPRLTSLTPLCGDHAGLGGLKVAGAAWTAKTRRLPSLPTLVEPVRAGAPFATGGRAWAVEGSGLVHGVARGGTHVALVVSPPA